MKKIYRFLLLVFSILLSSALSAIAQENEPVFPRDQERGYYSDEVVHFSALNAEQKAEICKQLAQTVCVLPSNDVFQYRVPRCGKSGHSYQENKSEMEKRSLVLLSTTVSGLIGKDAYLVDGNNVRLDIPWNASYVDGQSVTVIAKFIGTYDYVTVIGSPRRIPRYAAIDTYKITTEYIFDRLQKGDSFRIAFYKELTCPRCKGFGLISVNEKNKQGIWDSRQKNKLGWIKCTSCEGAKKIKRPLTCDLLK